MKECPRCKTKNRDSARFCKSCSVPLAEVRYCTVCGTANSDFAGFCRGCGKQLTLHTPPSLGTAWHSPSPQTGKIPPKTKVGARYVILNLIGRGGMGAVYLVEDSRLGNKKCALKEMSDSAIQDPGQRQQAVKIFQQEAQMLSNLSHVGLPRVTDYFSEGEKHFLVMDYIEGKSLAEMLDANQAPFPESRVLDWGDQLCDVLGYLHSQEPPIIYRDLKPENIIATTNRERVRLIDFGTARTYKPQKGKDTTAIGTPGFAPPEQYGKGQTDARSDVYALGVTLHQLLTLHDPGIKLFDIPPARTLNPDISTHVEHAIKKAVEKDVHKRWQSVAEFQQALKTPRSVPKPKSSSAPAKISTASTPVAAAKAGTSQSTPSAASVPGKAKMVSPRKVAQHGPRLRAFIVDNLIVGVGLFFISLFFRDAFSDEAMALMTTLMFVWVFGYYTYYHATSGQTPGKRANHLKVVCKDGKSPPWLRAFWRSIIFFGLPSVLTLILFVGWLLYFVPLVENENRGLHDILAGTWVVQA